MVVERSDVDARRRRAGCGRTRSTGRSAVSRLAAAPGRYARRTVVASIVLLALAAAVAARSEADTPTSAMTSTCPEIIRSQPAWSPDGGTIAFVRGNPLSEQPPLSLWVMNADGAAARQLLPDDEEDLGPTWSPDGSKIAFTRWTPALAGGTYRRVHVVDADGSGLTNLEVPGGEVAWSPRGDKIAFATMRDGNPEVYVMDADGTGPTNLTNDPTAADHQPAWSPDGSKIAFASNRAGAQTHEYDVFVMDADGSDVRRVTSDPRPEWMPTWSPDGSRIAFSADVPPRPGVLFVVNADGSGRREVPLAANLASATFPDWSRGGRIAFAGGLALETGRICGESDIYTVNPDGSDLRKLTHSAPGPPPPAAAPPRPAPPPSAGDVCVVPRVVGRRLPTARRLIVQADCSVGRVRRVTARKRAGAVLTQRPAGGKRLPYRGRVHLVVSRGRPR